MLAAAWPHATASARSGLPRRGSSRGLLGGGGGLSVRLRFMPPSKLLVAWNVLFAVTPRSCSVRSPRNWRPWKVRCRNRTGMLLLALTCCKVRRAVWCRGAHSALVRPSRPFTNSCTGCAGCVAGSSVVLSCGAAAATDRSVAAVTSRAAMPSSRVAFRRLLHSSTTAKMLFCQLLHSSDRSSSCTHSNCAAMLPQEHHHVAATHASQLVRTATFHARLMMTIAAQ